MNKTREPKPATRMNPDEAGEMFYADNLTNSIYCGAEGTDEEMNGGVPPKHNDEAWSEIAANHGKSCEWVLTRAHRIDEDSIVVAVYAESTTLAGQRAHEHEDGQESDDAVYYRGTPDDLRGQAALLFKMASNLPAYKGAHGAYARKVARTLYEAAQGADPVPRCRRCASTQVYICDHLDPDATLESLESLEAE